MRIFVFAYELIIKTHKMIQGFVKGLLAYGKTLQLIVRYRLFKYMLLPGIISFILGAFILWGVFQFSDNLGAWMSAWYDGRGKMTMTVVSSILTGLILLIIAFLLFKYIVLLILSPFLSLLSERVEARLTDKPTIQTSFQPKQLANDFARGLRLSVRLLLSELLLTASVLLLSVLLPFLSPISAILILFIQAYFAGAGNLDFTLERHYNYRESLHYLKQYRGLAMGNGIVFVLLFFTGIGFLIAPTLATIAGTVAVVEQRTR